MCVPRVQKLSLVTPPTVSYDMVHIYNIATYSPLLDRMILQGDAQNENIHLRHSRPTLFSFGALDYSFQLHTYE